MGDQLVLGRRSHGGQAEQARVVAEPDGGARLRNGLRRRAADAGDHRHRPIGPGWAAPVFMDQAVGAWLPVICAGLPKRRPNSSASQRMEVVSGPLTLSGEVGTVATARQRKACALASPCQITLTWPMVTSTGSPRQ